MEHLTVDEKPQIFEIRKEVLNAVSIFETYLGEFIQKRLLVSELIEQAQKMCAEIHMILGE